MKAERDRLVKFVFPQLRRLCEERGVGWGEVDLRWGITDEQAAEGAVLSICLEEINRCRPYLVCMLGERYGQTRPSFQPKQSQRCRTHWITFGLKSNSPSHRLALAQCVK
jgi:hypothetical protein